MLQHVMLRRSCVGTAALRCAAALKGGLCGVSCSAPLAARRGYTTATSSLPSAYRAHRASAPQACPHGFRGGASVQLSTVACQRRAISFSYASRIPCVRFDVSTARLARVTEQPTLPPTANIYLIDARATQRRSKRVRPKATMTAVVAAHRAEVQRAAEEQDADDAHTPPLIFLVKTDDTKKQAARRQAQMDADLDALGAFGEFRVCVLDGTKSRRWAEYVGPASSSSGQEAATAAAAAAAPPPTEAAAAADVTAATAAAVLNAVGGSGDGAGASLPGLSSSATAAATPPSTAPSPTAAAATDAKDVTEKGEDEEEDEEEEWEWVEVEVDADDAAAADGSADAVVTDGSATTTTSSEAVTAEAEVPAEAEAEAVEINGGAAAAAPVGVGVSAVWAHVKNRLRGGGDETEQAPASPSPQPEAPTPPSASGDRPVEEKDGDGDAEAATDVAATATVVEESGLEEFDIDGPFDESGAATVTPVSHAPAPPVDVSPDPAYDATAASSLPPPPSQPSSDVPAPPAVTDVLGDVDDSARGEAATPAHTPAAVDGGGAAAVVAVEASAADAVVAALPGDGDTATTDDTAAPSSAASDAAEVDTHVQPTVESTAAADVAAVAAVTLPAASPPPPTPSVPLPAYLDVPARLYRGAATVHLSDRACLELPATANVLVVDRRDWVDTHMAAIDSALELVDPVAGHVLLYPDAYAPRHAHVAADMTAHRLSLLPFIFVFRTQLSSEAAAATQRRLTHALHVRPTLTNTAHQSLVAGQHDRTSVCVLGAEESEKGGENPLLAPPPTPPAKPRRPAPVTLRASPATASPPQAAVVAPPPASSPPPTAAEGSAGGVDGAGEDDAVQRLWDLLRGTSRAARPPSERAPGLHDRPPPPHMAAAPPAAPHTSAAPAPEAPAETATPAPQPRLAYAADHLDCDVADPLSNASAKASSLALAQERERTRPPTTLVFADDGDAEQQEQEQEQQRRRQRGAAPARRGLFNFGTITFGKDNGYRAEWTGAEAEAEEEDAELDGALSSAEDASLLDRIGDLGLYPASEGTTTSTTAAAATTTAVRGAGRAKDGNTIPDEDVARIEEAMLRAQVRKIERAELRSDMRRAKAQKAAARATRSPSAAPATAATRSRDRRPRSPRSRGRVASVGAAAAGTQHAAATMTTATGATSTTTMAAVTAREQAVAEDAEVERFINDLIAADSRRPAATPTRTKSGTSSSERSRS